MYSSFTEEARKILILSKEEMKKLNHPYVGSEHLLLAILKTNNEVSDKLKDFDLTYENFKNELINVVGVGSKKSTCFLYTPLLKRVMENAIYDSKENNNGNVTITHLFTSLLEEGDGIAIRLLTGMNIDLDEIYKEFSNKFIFKKSKSKKLLIDEIGIDLTKEASKNLFDPVVGRENEINQIIQILCRKKKNNPILIGDAGVGKTAIVEELSRLIVNNQVPLSIKNKRIISLDMSTIVAGTKYRGEFEEKVNKILKEIEENDDIILFIDEIHTLVGAGGAEGAIDAANIFKPALARGKIRCIGATTTLEYKSTILNDKALDRRFQKVDIEEPDNKTVKKILNKLSLSYSNYHKVIITDKIIDKIIELSNKYLTKRKQPDKSIDVLDEVCSYVSLKEDKKLKKYNNLTKDLENILSSKKNCLLKKDYSSACTYKEKENLVMTKINKLELNISKSKKIIKEEDVEYVVSRMCKIPSILINDFSISKIKSLESYLNKNIIGQEKNINELIKIYKKIKLGLKDDDSCFSILFTGPTGVGKTKLANLFAHTITNNVLKLDMSEYSEAHTVSKLIGSPSGYVGYNDNKNVFEFIKDNPFSVIILDEIDKAHQQVLNLFYQILDEGKVKDSKGEDIYFNNTFIIMTTNVGYNRKEIGFNKSSINIDELKSIFKIPFINRIDTILKFNYLDEESVKKIIQNKLSALKNKYNKKCKSIRFSNNLIQEILDISNYKEYGIRDIERIIKNDIDSIIINEILNSNTNINIKNLKKEELIN